MPKTAVDLTLKVRTPFDKLFTHYVLVVQCNIKSIVVIQISIPLSTYGFPACSKKWTIWNQLTRRIQGHATPTPFAVRYSILSMCLVSTNIQSGQGHPQDSKIEYVYVVAKKFQICHRYTIPVVIFTLHILLNFLIHNIIRVGISIFFPVALCPLLLPIIRDK